MTKQEIAIQYHDKGYNCCQSVACAFAKEIGVDEVTLFKAGEAFGLGMGCTECTCGALSGAIMLAGFQKSTANLDGEKSKGVTYQTAKELVQKFEEKAGAVSCKDIKGIETGKMLHSCPDCIKDAAALVEEVLHL